MVTKEDITKLYIALFQRVPTESDVNYWFDSAVKNSYDIVTLANTMVEAAKNATHLFGLADVYPEYANYDPNNPESIKKVIEAVYSTIFDKDAKDDPEGIQYWTDEVVKKGKSIGEVVVAIENAAEDIKAHPEKYQQYFDENTLQHAIKATEKFEARVKAAEELQKEIKEISIDKNSIEELKNILKQINSEEDVQKETIKSKLKEIIQHYKDKEHLDDDKEHWDNNEEHSEIHYNNFDEETQHYMEENNYQHEYYPQDFSEYYFLPF